MMRAAMADEGKSTEQAAGGEAAGEEELRAQLEEEIRKVKVEDVILQSVVSILNLAARRIAKDDERDLAQGKLGIDAAHAVVGLVPEEAQPQIRQAISELQLLYAKHAEDGESQQPGETTEGEPAKDVGAGEKPAEEKRDSPLWTPPGAD
jgi:hypothetical protein